MEHKEQPVAGGLPVPFDGSGRDAEVGTDLVVGESAVIAHLD